MNSHITNSLLALVAVLLLAHLVTALDLQPNSTARATTGVADVVRAKLIELVDDRGQVVAQLHKGEDGGGQLRLRSGSGTVRVKLGSTSDGSGLILMDSESEPAIWHSVSRAGTSVTLAQKGKDRRVLAP